MPTIQQIHRNLCRIVSSLRHCGHLASELSRAISTRFPQLFAFDESSSLYAAAAVSHPKFKLRWVVDENRKLWAKDTFVAFAQKLIPIETPAAVQPSAGHSSDDFFDFVSTSEPQAGAAYATVALADGVSHSQESSVNSISNSIVIDCLKYLEEPCSDTLSTLNSHPRMKTLFRLLNASVPSSAPVERLFSKGSLISVPRRNRLSDKHFEQLLLLQANK